MCSNCKTKKPFDDFWKNQVWCKACSKDRRRQYYLDNKAVEDARNKNARKELLLWAQELKRGECVDCGNIYHPVAMDWEHPQNNKLANVSDLVRKGYSKQRILDEIEKCQLVCANCHRVRTYERSVRSSARTRPCHG